MARGKAQKRKFDDDGEAEGEDEGACKELFLGALPPLSPVPIHTTATRAMAATTAMATPPDPPAGPRRGHTEGHVPTKPQFPRPLVPL